MKKHFSTLVALLCFAFIQSKAQTPFNTMDSVDINNLHANVLMHGDMWYNPITEKRRCYSTNDSVNMSGGGGFWMSGYDAGGQLHAAAATYRTIGIDFWPGPLDGSGPLTYAASQNWSKIWKVNRTDIQYFQSLSLHTISNTPQSILTWPGKGNANAQGSGGATLTISNNMAPFVDLNNNGVYEPLLGEYPDIKGDQALWWIWNDNGPTHTATQGNPLGLEVHVMAYGYRRGTLIDNVIYYEYTLVNRSPNTYTNFRIAQWDEADIGEAPYFADFIGYDSTWRMGIGYHGVNDDGPSAGHPLGFYGPHSVMSAITMIELPGDAGSSYVQPGCFNYFNNDASYIGNPTIDTQYNNYMRAKNKNGMHLKNDFTGGGTPSTGYGTGPDCNYVFSGDVASTSAWSECGSNNNPGDRRFVFSSNDFTLNSGASQKLVLALIATNRGVEGCPHTTFDSIRIVADTAWGIYHHPLPVLSVANNAPIASSGITLYPNPAGDKLFIENTGNSIVTAHIAIYNAIGQVTNVPMSMNGKKAQANISSLPQGVYYVIYRDDDHGQQIRKFVKQ